MTETIAVALHGACGRMGIAVENEIKAAPDMTLVFRSDQMLTADPGPPRCGPDLSALNSGDVAGIIDFSLPDGAQAALEAAQRIGSAFVSGTTGLSDTARAALQDASKSIPVCWAPNFSTGVPILVKALGEAAGRLPDGWQTEIVDIHHSAKRDAPSGTAIRLAETWQRIKGGTLQHGREGIIGPRDQEEIGIHALRAGNVTGEHTVLLAGTGERIELVHRVQDRSAFASGSLEALRRILRQGPGLYEWEDLLCGG